MNAILFKAGVAIAVPIDHAHWTSYLLAAIDERREVQAITKQIDEPTVDDAYAIQAALLELQLARGDKLSWPRAWQARGSPPKMFWTPPRRWWVFP